jgi:hypothetical protein
MPCNFDGYTPEHIYIPAMLCAACKHLTREQMKTIQVANNICDDLLYWYCEHLIGDFMNSKGEEKKKAKKELHRIGVNIKKFDFGYEIIGVE